MELVSNYTHWQNLTEVNAPKAILTGTSKNVETLNQEADGFLREVTETGSVLDFACGVGRNTIALSKKFESVTSYDFPNMIGMLKSTKAFKERSNIDATTDWDVVTSKKYDAIYCALCLQHMSIVDMLNYLKAFTELSNNLYVVTRWYNDFDRASMFNLLTEYWHVDNTYGKDLTEIKNASGEYHYVMKLTCN